ncbi:MAG: Amuc_1100 family pilus-like protein [Kiritimatiellaeota bacterium]|nr:Amuc_1100 family pilus-like protein [Kiritimatiellota bacterium]
MNRQKGMMIGGGALLAIVCVGIGVLFVMVLMKSQAVKGERDTAFQNLQKFYKTKIFPNDVNVKQMNADQGTLKAWLESATNQLAKSAIPMTKTSPAQFAQRLNEAIRKMVGQSNPSGRPPRVAAEFRFGFDRYKGGDLPENEDVPRLNQQLDIIQLLVNELNAANIVKLEGIDREVFEGGDSAESGGEPGRIRNKEKAQGSGVQAEAEAMDPALEKLFDCQRFTLVFQTQPDTFADVLNRLSAMEMLVTVSGMEFKKMGDSVARERVAKRDTAAARPGEKPLEPAAPERLIVTNPELEPPISVRLRVDVYSFRGE